MKPAKKSLGKVAAILTGMTIFSKFLGVVRDSFIAYKFGTSGIVDAYTVSLTFANIALSLFAIGFSEAYVTVFARIHEKAKERYFNNTVTIMFLISCVLAVLFYLAANGITYILAPGFDCETHSLLVQYIKIICVVIPLQAVFSILLSNEMARENFIFPKFCDFIVINSLVIVAISFASPEKSYIMPVGYVLANLVAVLFMALYAIKQRSIRYHFLFHIKDSDFRKLFVLAIPLGISYLINDLNTMSDGMFASTIGTGVTSALNYANKIQSLFLAVTVNIISVVCFPRISSCFANRCNDKACYYLQKSMMIALFISFPFTVFLLFHSSLVVRILFERGNFNGESAFITSSFLIYYCMGIPFYAMCNVQTQALAANAKQKCIMAITTVSVLINILLDFALLKIFGYVGLPIATSVAGVFQFFFLYIETKKIGVAILNTDHVKEIGKVILAVGIASFIPAAKILLWPKNNKMILEIVLACLFLGVYFILCALFRVNIFFWLIKALSPVKMRE